MSEIEPTFIDKEQHDAVNAIMALPRKERRRMGKQMGVKIPGSNKPHGNHQTKEIS